MSGYDWRRLWDDVTGYIGQEAARAVAPFTIGGKLDRGTRNAVGMTPIAGGGTGHDRGAEPPLGNPASDGQVLASTTGGVRSWVTPATGGTTTTSAAAVVVPLDPTTTAGDLIVRSPHAGPTTIPLGFIGDSITYGELTTTPAPTLTAQDLTGHGLTVTALNQGHGGAQVSDWLPGATSGYLATAKAAFAAAGVRIVHLMLGTNDAGHGVTAAAYRANLAALLADLVASGYLVVLAYSPGTNQGPVNSLLTAYQAEIDALSNGVTVLRGDTRAYQYFLDNNAAQTADGVHPNDTGTPVLAQYWADALRPLVQALAGPQALDRIGIGPPGTYLQVNGAGTGYQFATPAGGGGGTSYSWEPLVTGLAAQSAVTTDSTPGDPVWAGGDFVMVGTPYTPH